MSVYNTKNLKTGYYHVVNKNKLKNEKKVLFYRSGLEKKFMKNCDFSSSTIEWDYENIVIPYQKLYNIGTKKINHYIIDFWIKKIINGKIKEFLVEIKPYAFLSPPPYQKRVTKKYLELIENHSTNKSKWKAASSFCDDKGWEFAIVTEKDLK